VRAFWVARVEAAASDAGAADLLTARAKKASAAASAKRATAGGQA
jgi:hypothetical protein